MKEAAKAAGVIIVAGDTKVVDRGKADRIFINTSGVGTVPSGEGAGTCEFLVDAKRDFYFLEMNTRLQVEHPVTEMVTGIDIVKEQIRVAAGEKLSIRQEDVKQSGHAIECRVYAEDPERNFMPCPGVVTSLRVPGGPGVRDDSGMYEGFEIPIFYDPIISKLVAWGKDRTEAIARMKRALAEYVVTGVKTTIPFHIRVQKF